MTLIKAKKHLWQNFLKNTKILESIVGWESLEGIHIVEIWPGPWDLTQELLRRKPLSLSLIELDKDMVPLLENRFRWISLSIYLNDVLQMNIVKSEEDLSNQQNKISISQQKVIEYSKPYSVYGNIPYYITSPILHHFLYDVDFPPTQAVFTMQKEVADRIISRENHTVLSLSCQLVADIKKVCDISPQNFTPVPKVWSTCLKFTLKKVDRREICTTLWTIKKWFSQKRKKLITNLFQHGYSKKVLLTIFFELWLSENVRAEELSLEQWKILSGKVN